MFGTTTTLYPSSDPHDLAGTPHPLHIAEEEAQERQESLTFPGHPSTIEPPGCD